MVLMKQNKILLYAVVFSIFFFFRIFFAVSQEGTETVNDSAFEKRSRPPVTFFHDAHNEMANINECNVCHHLFEDVVF